MPNLGIPHLTFGQSDVHSARAEPTPRIGLIKIIVVWRLREQRRIAISLRTFSAMGINSPSVPDHQHHWLRHTGVRLTAGGGSATQNPKMRGHAVRLRLQPLSTWRAILAKAGAFAYGTIP